MKTPRCLGTTGIGSGEKGGVAVALFFLILIALPFLEKGSVTKVHITDQSCMLLETTYAIV